MVKDKKNVYVAISGGVDSSAAAFWAKKQGYKVTGVFMKMWSPPLLPCDQKAEKLSAMRVCANLDIPFKSWDFTREYKERVADYMIKGYKAGRTPNPDVMCNREIKFGLFFDRAIKEGADYIATGHYVRLRREFPISNFQFPSKSQTSNTNYQLLRARDKNKDQSYFLWTLTQKHLSRTLFPIGEFKDKNEVREYAKKAGLATWQKKDSQGVCFVGEINMQHFLKNYITSRPGPVVSVTGRKVGEHTGLEFYTIGQRKGINVSGGPYYVSSKKTRTNTLVVSPPSQEESLFSSSFFVSNISFVGPSPKSTKNISASVRYRQNPQNATLKKTSKDRWQVEFKNPIRAVTIGQSVVFYEKDTLLGGGIIEGTE